MTKQFYIDQLFNTMGQLRKLLENQTQESHEEKTATIMQYSALKFLKNKKNSTVGDIAEHLRLSKSSATQLIERLVKAGFVERTVDQEDRRIVHLTVSTTGSIEMDNLKKRFIERVGKVFSKIPDKDLQELIRIHTELIETLQKEQNS